MKRFLALVLLAVLLSLSLGCEAAQTGDVLGLMYHHLTENPEDISAWTITPDEFRRTLTDILALGYEPLSLEDYIEGNYDAQKDYFIVTFDDGYQSNLILAKPILSEMEIPATIFVVTGSVGEPLYMTWEEIQSARDSGVFTLYSHTHSHLSATEVPLDAFLADEATAQENLFTHLGKTEYCVLSYPNGAYTKESMKHLKDEGYDLLVIQDKPRWHREARYGRLLLRVNVPGVGADMKEIANYHRERCGIGKIQ